MPEAFIDGQQDIESDGLRLIEQKAVPQRIPAHIGGRSDGVAREKSLEPPIEAMVNQYLHGFGSRSSKPARAARKTAWACSRVTPGKPSKNSSRGSPPSR